MRAMQLVPVLLCSSLVYCLLVGPSAVSAVSGYTRNATEGQRGPVLRQGNGKRDVLRDDSCGSGRLAVYKVVLRTYWTRDLFPKHYPDWRPPAQWTNTIGRTHDDTFHLFKMGHQASPVVKQFVETGHSDMLGLTGNASVLDEFFMPPINSGSGSSEVQFFVDGNHSRVSLVTRIVPSPDWFIGMDSLQLCVGGSWIDRVTIEMEPLDAGTDNGFTFTAPNWPTEPQGVIYRITSTYPAHPASSFYYPEEQRLPPIATYQFIKLKEYELSQKFSGRKEDTRVYSTNTNLRSEPNQVDMNNELSANIEKERQQQMIPVPLLPSKRDRKRAKLLARLGTTNINTTPTPPTESPRRVLKDNKAALLNSISETYKGSTPHKYRNWMTGPPRDCRVGQWSSWNVCSKTCGIGEMQRHRKVVRPSKRGGRPCPPLQESKWCGSAKDCSEGYFKW